VRIFGFALRPLSSGLPVGAVPGGPAATDTQRESAERDALWRLVRALPPRQRTVIVLRYYEDYDDATIAEMLQCSAGTVRTQAKRALDKLQERRQALEAAKGER
jgi:RNA polymerase sigma factor (sigma-70 family)